MRSRDFFRAVALILVIGVFSAGCITPPKETPPEPWTPPEGTMAQTPTPTQKIMDTRYITPATPFPTPTPAITRPASSLQPNFTVEPTIYKVIYLNTMDFKYSVSAYSTTVDTPPLIIEICLVPKMVTRNIWYESRFTTRDDVYTTQTYISPASYFEIRVRDKGSGEIVEKEGFGKTYSVDTKKVLQVRRSGEYLIEFSGNDIVATVQMRVPAPIDSQVTPAGTLACPAA